MNVTAEPSWDVIAKDIRAQIASGKYPVGEPIPSTTRLMEQHGVSKSPVRQAVQTLKSEGLLAGRPGKAVYVTGLPVAEEPGELPGWARKIQEDMAGMKADIAELQGQRGVSRRPARKQERGNEQSG